MKISFHGANQGVTGSCHMVECAGKRILIDCGLYQGGREIEEENQNHFGFDPASIDYLLLTHAHLDHCGRIPLLSKRGFHGEIITTAASRELARLVMLDAARLQEEEARYQARKKNLRYNGENIQPLYSVLDALNSTEYFGRTAVYNKKFELTPGVDVTFLDAGHILGSASIYLQLKENNVQKSLLYSGDLGNAGRPLLGNPTTPQHTDVVVMETTYGDRQHRPLEDSVEEFYDALTDAFRRGGNVIIPTFALERAQELLYYLRDGIKQDILQDSMQAFLDSPMAISATEIFKNHPECYDLEVAKIFQKGQDPFHIPGLHFTRETSESMALNQINGGAVILAGSGMCTGGRVRHHLRHNLWRKESSVIFVGFAARGTLARQIIDGAKKVRIFGKEIRVRANIYTINGFSAHADQAELLEWHRKLGSPQRTFLVHGEMDATSKFARLLHETEIEIPALGESFTL